MHGVRSNFPYRGESPQKRLARLTFWTLVCRALGRKKFLKGRYAVLASREAGDVSVLLGMGVPLKNIVCFDWNGREAAGARLRYPGLVIHEGDVVDEIQRYPKWSFTAAFLDFCSPATNEYLTRVSFVARHYVRLRGLIGCGFFIGREVSTLKKIIGLRSHFEKRLEDSTDWSGRFAVLARGALIESELISRLRPTFPQTLSFLYYQSKTELSKGQPMCLHLARLVGGRCKTSPSIHHFDQTEKELRSYAKQLVEETGDAAPLLLNASVERVRAWIQ